MKASMVNLISDGLHRRAEAMTPEDRPAMGPLKVPGMEGWRHEPGEAFFAYGTGGAAVFLGAVLTYFTVYALTSRPEEGLSKDLFFLGLLWLVVLIFALICRDSIWYWRLTRNTYVKYIAAPLEEVEGDLVEALRRRGVRFERTRLVPGVSLLNRGPNLDHIEFRLEGADFRVVVKHQGPSREEPDREYCLLIVGPASDRNLAGILPLLRAYEGVDEEDEPPDLVVYGRRQRRDRGD